MPVHQEAAYAQLLAPLPDIGFVNSPFRLLRDNGSNRGQCVNAGSHMSRYYRDAIVNSMLGGGSNIVCNETIASLNETPTVGICSGHITPGI